MWKVVFDSVQGTSHGIAGFPCQDSCRALTREFNGDQTLIAVCSDGAGSASHSDRGSTLICDAFIEFFNTNSPRELLDRSTGFSIAEYVVNTLHNRLDCLATELNVISREVACTFLGAVVMDSIAAFLQIGDGAIVIRSEGEYKPVFWPQSGEYLNTTNFLTDQNFQDVFEFEIDEGPFDEIAMFTDGIQNLALRTADRGAHGPFFRPMFEALRAVENTETLFEPLRTFLNSGPVNDRTDDDKTLILAARATAALKLDAPVL